MSSRRFDRRRSNDGRERSAYNNLQKPPKEPMESEIVKVPGDLKGRVIGKGGCIIKEIMTASGALISSPRKDGAYDDCFTVSGDGEQRACAKKLILEKVEEICQRMREGASPGELVEIPDKYKGLVMGKGGDNLREISTLTGAKVIRKGGEVYITDGTREQREQAKVHIKVKIAGARVRGVENEFTKICCYVDGWNLTADGRVKLEQLVPGDRMFLPGPQAQYRLRSAEDYGPQDAFGPGDNPSYLVRLKKEALESLRQIKSEIETKGYLKLDMWCHFGTAIVRGPDEG